MSSLSNASQYRVGTSSKGNTNQHLEHAVYNSQPKEVDINSGVPREASISTRMTSETDGDTSSSPIDTVTISPSLPSASAAGSTVPKVPNLLLSPFYRINQFLTKNSLNRPKSGDGSSTVTATSPSTVRERSGSHSNRHSSGTSTSVGIGTNQAIAGHGTNEKRDIHAQPQSQPTGYRQMFDQLHCKE
jgi:hypothetical protein